MWLYLTIHQHKKFLSTPSARRATRSSPSILTVAWISIHALREEGDPECRCRSGCPPEFLSTPSARRATQSAGAVVPAFFYISIHALREEGDLRDADALICFIISIHALREEGVK